MKILDPLIYSSFDELKENLATVRDLFISDSVVAVRGLHLTLKEQNKITKLFGDLITAIPNSESDFDEVYQENHSRINPSSYKSDEVAVGWHIEHVEYDDYTEKIVVAGVWNMFKFNTDTENGNTYFLDTSDIYKYVLNEEERQFIDRVTVYWNQEDRDESGQIQTKLVSLPAVIPHWVTGEKVIRIPVHPLSKVSIKVDGIDGTDVEILMFEKIYEKFRFAILDDDSYRRVQKWQEGDLIFVDLFKNAHAVAGGFSQEDREFTGQWMYSSKKTSIVDGRVIPDWADHAND